MFSRGTLWLIFAVGLSLFVWSGLAMARRIAEFNERAHFARFNARLIADRAFELPGFPSVRLTDARTDREPEADQAEDAGSNAGDSWGAFLKLEYGDRMIHIPVRSPAVENAPNLAIYDEWMKVMAITVLPSAGEDGDARPLNPDTDRRLLIVTRTTPPGYDPDSWGSVRRSEWVFTFYNLMPDGSIVIEKRRWPRKRMGEKVLHELAEQDEARAGEEGGEPEPQTESDAERYRELAAIPPLSQRSVEYFAAMHVIPKLNVPSYKFSDTAFSFNTLGWTAPVAGLSFLVLTWSLFFAVAPRQRKGDQRPAARAA